MPIRPTANLQISPDPLIPVRASLEWSRRRERVQIRGVRDSGFGLAEWPDSRDSPDPHPHRQPASPHSIGYGEPARPIRFHLMRSIILVGHCASRRASGIRGNGDPTRAELESLFSAQRSPSSTQLDANAL